VWLIVCDLETTKRGGLGQNWAVAPYKKQPYTYSEIQYTGYMVAYKYDSLASTVLSAKRLAPSMLQSLALVVILEVHYIAVNHLIIMRLSHNK